MFVHCVKEICLPLQKLPNAYNGVYSVISDRTLFHCNSVQNVILVVLVKLTICLL